ncbi:MAG TPA: type II secretion system protein GspN [Desulfobacteraceae bacterium]|nr:type II secretion system protein GspN [Desulfobacteraceae bacterium]
MKTFIRLILSVLGYGVYTFAVLLLLLWFLFPAESVRVWLQAQLDRLNPALSWEIDELRVAWPLSVVARDIQAKQIDGGDLLMDVNEVKFRPNIKGLTRVRQEWPVSYQVKFLDGAVNGVAALDRDQPKVKCSGEMKDLQIGGLEGIWQQMGRSGSGTLSGPFSYEGELPELLSGDLQADLIVKNGSIELLQPVMGLENLSFNQLTASLSLEDRVMTITGGEMDSNLFAADFGGTITLTDNLLGSGLDISGTFEPRPELMGGLKDPAVMQLIKGQLRDNKLNFQLSDTLLAPGMLFQGTSGVIDGILQGSGR